MNRTDGVVLLDFEHDPVAARRNSIGYGCVMIHGMFFGTQPTVSGAWRCSTAVRPSGVNGKLNGSLRLWTPGTRVRKLRPLLQTRKTPSSTFAAVPSSVCP